VLRSSVWFPMGVITCSSRLNSVVSGLQRFQLSIRRGRCEGFSDARGLVGV
jgi:hypothetical protein